MSQLSEQAHYEKMNNKNYLNFTFQKHQVDEYERKRYRGLDQRLVDAREKQILRKLLKRYKKMVKGILLTKNC